MLNKQRAEIQLGARLGFRTLSQNYTSTIQQVQFLNVGTLLRIRPFVSTDGMVRMEIHPERSSGVVQDDLPSARTAELTTNVMVPDGATLVISGLMEDEDTYQQQGLPGISRVPVIGHVFGLKQKSDTRRELVVLLTPRIWSESAPDEGHHELATSRSPKPSSDEARASGDVANRAPTPSAPPASAAGRSASGSWRLEAMADPMTSPAAGPRSGFLAPDMAPSSRPAKPAAGTGGSGRPETDGGPQPAAALRQPKPENARSIKHPTAPGSPREAETREARPDMKLRRASLQMGIEPVQQHRVSEGDTLRSIARKYYGSDRYAPALWEANRAILSSPQGLEPGIDLNIPDISKLDQSMVRVIRASARSDSTSVHEVEGTEVASRGDEATRGYRPSGMTLPADVPAANQAGDLSQAAEPQEPPIASFGPGHETEELTDTLESQTDSGLGDVIDPGSPTSDDSAGPSRLPIPAVLAADAPIDVRREVQSEPTSVEMASFPGGTRKRLVSASYGDESGGFESPGDRTIPLALPGESPGTGSNAPSGRDLGRAIAGSLNGIQDTRTNLQGGRPINHPGPRISTEDQEPSGTDLDAPDSDEGGFAVHVVRRHETLRTIARDRLGDSRRADEILALNRDLFGEDIEPRPGVRLILPPRSKESRASR